MAEPAPASGEAASEPGRDPSSTSGEPADSASDERDDEELAALAALAARVDPVPEKVAEAARRAFERQGGPRRCSRPEA
jgi:hypothetical protein